MQTVSGVAERKFPPRATNTVISPSCIAAMVSTVSCPGLPRRREAELLVQGVEKGPRRPLPDPHRAVALHVGVPADAAGPRAGPADVAAEQQQVDQHADGRHGVAVLGQAHRPAGDHPLRARDHARRRARSLPAGCRSPPRCPATAWPRRSAYSSANPSVCSRMNSWSSTPPPGFVLREQHLHQPLEQGDVAVDAHRKVEVGQRRARAEHARGEVDRAWRIPRGSGR